MSGAELTAIAPHLALAAAAIALLLVISFVRRHALVVALTVAGLAATLAAIVPAAAVVPMDVTALLRVDGMALAFCALFALAAIAVALLAHRYASGRAGDPGELHLLLLLATLGAAVLAAASHFATLLLGLEILSISLYAMVAYPEEGRQPLEAALKYLVLSGVASTTLLMGMAFVYLQTGSLGFEGMAEVAAGGSLYAVAGSVLVLVGLAFKLSLVPFHLWTPDVYQGAPAPVAGFLATVSKAAVFVVLLRYLQASGGIDAPAATAVLAVLAGLSMLIGNLLALVQDNVKRVLAYSSIAHQGYLLIALILTSQPGEAALGIEAAMVYLAAYFVMTLGAFGVVGALSSPSAGHDFEALRAYRGLLWRQPLVAAVFMTMLLSLAGIPLTMGFIAKFYLIAAGVSGALWVLVWMLVIGSGIGLYYYLRIIYAMVLSAEPATVRERVPSLPCSPC